MNSRNLTFHEEYSFFSAIMFLVWKIFSVQTVSSVMFFFLLVEESSKMWIEIYFGRRYESQTIEFSIWFWDPFNFRTCSPSWISRRSFIWQKKSLVRTFLHCDFFLTNNSSFKACSMSSLSSKKIRSGISFWLNELYR